MRDVLIALAPAALYGAYIFGFRALMILILSVVSAVGCEALCQKIRGIRVTVNDYSAAVTGLLLGMNLPSSVPLWIPVIGSVFAIAIVKQAFGGLGSNFVNPALAARIFLVSSWSKEMSSYPSVVDGTASPTLLNVMKYGGGESLPSLMDAFIGNIGGCIGETSALLLLLGGIYLIARKVISYKIPVLYLSTVALLTYLLQGFDFTIMLYHLLSGGLMIGAFFMATDYASSPITPKGQVIYACSLGVLTTIIRLYGGYPEGVSFAILIMNVATPLIERYTKPKVFGGAK